MYGDSVLGYNRIKMNERLVFTLLLCVVGVLWCIIGYWRRKAGEAAFAAARMADNAENRDRYCRLAVMAGHQDACHMFCLSHPDLFEEHPPLKPFKSHGIRMTFYEYYYPSRYKAFLNDEQRKSNHLLYPNFNPKKYFR